MVMEYLDIVFPFKMFDTSTSKSAFFLKATYNPHLQSAPLRHVSPRPVLLAIMTASPQYQSQHFGEQDSCQLSILSHATPKFKRKLLAAQPLSYVSHRRTCIPHALNRTPFRSTPFSSFGFQSSSHFPNILCSHCVKVKASRSHAQRRREHLNGDLRPRNTPALAPETNRRRAPGGFPRALGQPRGIDLVVRLPLSPPLNRSLTTRRTSERQGKPRRGKSMDAHDPRVA